MRLYNKYIKNEDHCWYDSSNILYSVLFDDQTDSPKSLKIVFKGGRTYLYKNVDPMDYVLFRDSDSQGKTFNEVIRKYDCVQLENTEIGSLDELRREFEKMDESRGNLNISIVMNNTTGEFTLSKDGMPTYDGVEGKVSIINLLKSLNIDANIEFDEDFHIQTTEEFDNKRIIK